MTVSARCPVPAISLSQHLMTTCTGTPSANSRPGGLTVTSFSDDHIEGTVQSKGGALFTSIPYDAGWKVRVDGQPVETYGVSKAFLAFDMPAGEHTVEMRYRPQGLLIGLILSAFSLCLVIFLAILTHIRLQRKRDARLLARYGDRAPRRAPDRRGLEFRPFFGSRSGCGFDTSREGAAGRILRRLGARSFAGASLFN